MRYRVLDAVSVNGCGLPGQLVNPGLLCARMDNLSASKLMCFSTGLLRAPNEWVRSSKLIDAGAAVPLLLNGNDLGRFLAQLRNRSFDFNGELVTADMKNQAASVLADRDGIA